MSEVDLSPLIEVDNQFKKAVTDAEDKYKGDWDDPVHDSYRGLNAKLDEDSRNLHTIRCQAETIKKELYGLKVEELISRADSLCMEAASV